MIADLSRSGPAHACRTPDAVANLLAGRSPRHLRRQIQALALKIHQSGRAQVALEQLVDLPQLDPLPEMYFLRCLLSDGSPGVVFKNPALGDYNCGERSPAACNSSPSAPAPPMARPLSWPAMAMWPSTFTASWAMPPSPPAWCALS